jgi:hypothetical protein
MSRANLARVFLWTDGDAKIRNKRPKGAEQSTSQNKPILMLFSGDFNVQRVDSLMRWLVNAEGKVCGAELKTVWGGIPKAHDCDCNARRKCC